MVARVNVTVLRMALVTGIFAASTAVAAAQSYELIAAAKEEGALTTMALAEDWCGYGELIKGFEAKYGIEVTDLNPNASSVEQLEALRADKDRETKAGPGRRRRDDGRGPAGGDGRPDRALRVATWDTHSRTPQGSRGALGRPITTA